MTAEKIANLAWDKSGGLIPAVVQDAATLQVLMVAWMDEAALRETLESGEATFFSRSRGGRWRKGETSGDRLEVVSVTPDCDGDTLLVQARPLGPACHLKTTSCFGAQDAPGLGRLARLEQIIAARAKAGDSASSYVARLLASGPLKCAQKVGEEGVETALAGAAQDDSALTVESADLLFHLLVLLRSRGLSLSDVLAELDERAGPPRTVALQGESVF